MTRCGFLISVVGLGVLAVGCEDAPEAARTWKPSDHGHPPKSQVDPSRVPGNRRGDQNASPREAGTGDPTTRAATALWRVSCARCHGAEGQGDGPGAPSGMQIPDLTTAAWQRGITDEEIRRVIAGGAKGMPAFGERISDEGITALVDHIRDLAAPAPDAGTPDAN